MPSRKKVKSNKHRTQQQLQNTTNHDISRLQTNTFLNSQKIYFHDQFFIFGIHIQTDKQKYNILIQKTFFDSK